MTESASRTPDSGIEPAGTLIGDIRGLIEHSRTAVAATVNAALTLVYWRVGRRIREDILEQERAAYGDQIVVTLSRQLVADYGKGFAEKNLRRMIQFAETFPDEQIVVTLSRELSWSHFLTLLPLKQPLQREFYAELCRAERWSVRALRERIGSMLYERTALSRKPEEVARLALAALLEEIANHLRRGESFAFETTLSGRRYAALIPEWRTRGYVIKLFFLRLASPELAVARVRQRVREGGHNVPEPVIRRRFASGLGNFETRYKPLVDEWALYDSSRDEPILVEEGVNA